MRKYIVGAFVALSLVAIAACGGGGQNDAIISYPTPANVTSGTVTSGGTSITMAATGGLALGTVSVKGSGTVQASQSATQPASVPALQSVVRSSSSTVAATSKRAASSGNTAVAYVTLTATSATTLTEVELTVAPTSAIPSGTYYAAFWNGSQWVTVGTAATVSGGLISVSTGTLSPSVTLTSGSSYYVAVYTGQVFTTPTPQPSAPVASPSALTLSEGQQGTITVTTNPGLAITASSSSALVSVSPSPSATANASGQATFTVTAALATGTATVTFTDPVRQTTTATITVNNTAPTPSPLPGAPTIGVGDDAIVAISAKPNTLISISSSSSTVAPVAAGGSGATPSPAPAAPGASSFGSSATVTTSSTGVAYFWVSGTTGGVANITLTDPYSNTDTFQVVVSNISNGTFSNGLTGWAPCSYVHNAANPPTNLTSPLPASPPPSPYPTQSAVPTESPIPLASLSPLITTAAVPANDNPGYPNAGSISANGITYVTPTSSPSVLGTTVAFIGTIDSSKVTLPKGESGMCQTFTVPSTTPYLSLWVWEGGSGFSFATADQEVAIFPSYSANVASGTPTYLLAEQNCYVHPNTPASGSSTAGGTYGGSGYYQDSGCWPEAYDGDTCANYSDYGSSTCKAPFYDWIQGGFWSQRGPYSLSSFAGQTVTLFIGNWSYYKDTGSYYGQWMFVGNVELQPTSTFPTTAPLSKQRRVLGTVQLSQRNGGTIQSTIRKP